MAKSGPVGSRFTIAGPTRPGPTISLLSSAAIVPNVPGVDGTQTDPTGERWLHGIQYRPEKCDTSIENLYVGCGESPTKDTDYDDQANTETDPFLVWAGDECSALGWEAADYVGRAQRYFAAREAFKVENEFWTGAAAQAGTIAGVDYSTYQWLAHTNADILNSGTATPVLNAMSFLQGALGDCSGGSPGMIHVPAEVLPFLQALQIVRRDGNRYLDGLDNIVVPGFGYPGTSPSAVAPAAGHSWAYATGMVTIRRTDPEVLPRTFADAFDRATNHVEFRVERYYLVDFDRCCHAAINMQLCTDSAC